MKHTAMKVDKLLKWIGVFVIFELRTIRGREESTNGVSQNYEYRYYVVDENTGDVKSQEEKKIGEEVIGHYTVGEPTGDLRVVSYNANKDGFQADVKYEEGGSPYSNIGQQKEVKSRSEFHWLTSMGDRLSSSPILVKPPTETEDSSSPSLESQTEDESSSENSSSESDGNSPDNSESISSESSNSLSSQESKEDSEDNNESSSTESSSSSSGSGEESRENSNSTDESSSDSKSESEEKNSSESDDQSSDESSQNSREPSTEESSEEVSSSSLGSEEEEEEEEEESISSEETPEEDSSVQKAGSIEVPKTIYLPPYPSSEPKLPITEQGPNQYLPTIIYASQNFYNPMGWTGNKRYIGQPPSYNGLKYVLLPQRR